jgi:hypothetical protein
MTLNAYGHVLDIDATRPTTLISTPEDACDILAANHRPKRAAALRSTLRHVRAKLPHLTPYLTHPDILTGIADGRCCCPASLLRWLDELENIDTGDAFTFQDEGDNQL